MTFDNGLELSFREAQASLDCATGRVTVNFDIGMQIVVDSVGKALSFSVMVPDSV